MMARRGREMEFSERMGVSANPRSWLKRETNNDEFLEGRADKLFEKSFRSVQMNASR